MGAVENGTITLIGATTENPSFEVITPLLSRCQVYVLKPLDDEDLLELLHRVIKTDERLKNLDIQVDETEAILRFAGGDARKLLNIIELVSSSNQGETIHLTNAVVTKKLQQNPMAYDKDGEILRHLSACVSVHPRQPPTPPSIGSMIAGGETPNS